MTPAWQRSIVLIHEAHEKLESARDLLDPGRDARRRTSALMDDLADLADYIESVFAGDQT